MLQIRYLSPLIIPYYKEENIACNGNNAELHNIGRKHGILQDLDKFRHANFQRNKDNGTEKKNELQKCKKLLDTPFLASERIEFLFFEIKDTACAFLSADYTVLSAERAPFASWAYKALLLMHIGITDLTLRKLTALINKIFS